MEDFTGCVVRCKDFPYLNGRVVVKTIKHVSCKNKKSSLYEVQLDHSNRHYFLYENEMKEQRNGKNV